MNHNNLTQIFLKYIDRFEYVNGGDHREYYKWQVCKEFPTLMNKALNADDNEFVRALSAARNCSANIIDSYTQPFSGLVEYAKEEPGTVRDILRNLYADDGGDISVQKEIIADFFVRCDELLNRYYAGSHLFKQNSHSVSALLFLNDPDHHYMYKATQSKNFADCIEFYDDWGYGDNIQLEKYYRMCDELIEEIKNCKELLDTDTSRFDGRLKITGGELYPDPEKHILAFDIMYCCDTYDLFDGISYTKKTLKEKNMYMSQKTKAQELKQVFDIAQKNALALEEALGYFVDILKIDTKVFHKANGAGVVESVNDKYIVIGFGEKKVKLRLAVAIFNNIISVDDPVFEDGVKRYADVLKKYDSIPRLLEYASKDLEPYEVYLD